MPTSNWANQGVTPSRAEAEGALCVLAECWKVPLIASAQPLPGLSGAGSSQQRLKAWKEYRNPLRALKVPPHSVPSTSCETLPHFPDTFLTLVLSTSSGFFISMGSPQKFPSAIKKSNPLITLLPKSPQKLQFKVRVPVQMDVYTLLQEHTCTHNYSGIKQACKTSPV